MTRGRHLPQGLFFTISVCALLLFQQQHASINGTCDQSVTTTGVTGELPLLQTSRRFKKPRKFHGYMVFKRHINHKVRGLNAKWGVCTTISEISSAIERVASVEGWHVVVVGDVKTPHPISLANNIHFLSIKDQKEILREIRPFVDKVPLNHFGRKNIGYLYAIYHGASEIFDFDDDNFLKHDNILAFDAPKVVEMSVGTDCLVGNPYPIMGAPWAGKVPAWPRGYPLQYIKSNCSEKLNQWNPLSSIDILQYLADVDPDVDGIFRLTRDIPFSFTSNLTDTIAIKAGVYVPFNAQATYFKYKAFWSLLLPVTVHGRVSDIWRSYIAQKILWQLGGQLGFLSPGVDQIRNAHNPLADMNAEKELYEKSFGLIEILNSWIPSQEHVPGMLEEIYIILYEYGIVQLQDIILLQDWISSLISIGYNFPHRV